MAIGPMPHRLSCALFLVGVGCGSGEGSEGSSGGRAAGGASSGGGALSSAGGTRMSEARSGGASSGSEAGGSSGGAGFSGAGKGSAGAAGSGPPAAVAGRSVYALECHGDSKDCDLAAVPCFGVGTQTPGVAAGWACANRCSSDADCSSAPSGAEARASCVSFTSSGHCVLVCQNEKQTFACPKGMACYTPPQSPIGYCLWP